MHTEGFTISLQLATYRVSWKLYHLKLKRSNSAIGLEKYICLEFIKLNQVIFMYSGFFSEGKWT